MPVDDPFDAESPMLTFSEVRSYVAELPSDVLYELSKGPIGVDRTCRVCRALAPLLPVNPSEPAELQIDTEAKRAAYELKCWHDDLGRSSWFLDTIEPKLWPGEIERVNAEEKHIFGSLQYARCCTIYALAALELINRDLHGRRPPIIEVLNDMVMETQGDGLSPLEQARSAGVDLSELAHATSDARVQAVEDNYKEMGSDALLGGLGEMFVAGVRWEKGKP